MIVSGGPGKQRDTDSAAARRRVAAAAIVLAALLCHAPTVRNGFIWDDSTYVVRNGLLRDWAGLGAIWASHEAPQYYPVVFTTFWVESRLWGTRPAGYHAVNVGLHAINAALLFWLLDALALGAAFPVALFFAVHPQQVETVTWVAERKNLLAGFFALLWLLAHGQWMIHGNRRAYLRGLAAFVLALLSKSVVACLAVFPPLLTWWRHGRLRRADVLAVLPHAALGAAAGLHTAWLERQHVGAVGVAWHHTVAEHLILAGRIVVFYVGKLVWPRSLAFLYETWSLDARDAAQWLPLAAVLAAVTALFVLRDRIGRGAVCATACYLGALAPVLGFLNVYPMRFSYTADHFQYFAAPAGLLLAVGAVRAAWDVAEGRWAPLAAVRCPLGWVGTAAVALALAARSIAYAPAFADDETLWREAIARNPRAWLAYTNLGVLRGAQGRHEEAMRLMYTAEALAPDRNDEAVYNIALDLERQGRRDEARARYERVLRINPRLGAAHYSLGNLALAEGRRDEAVGWYEKAVEVDPRFTLAYYALGNLAQAEGRTDAARVAYEAALRIDSEFAPAHNNLGAVLLNGGDLAGAEAHFRRAVTLDPLYRDARLNLALVLEQTGRAGEAATEREVAGRLAPSP